MTVPGSAPSSRVHPVAGTAWGGGPSVAGMHLRHLLPVPAALLVVALAGCGSSGPPTDASIDDFCDAMADYWVSAESVDMADAVRAAESLSATGTPEAAPDYVRRTATAMADWLGSDDAEDMSYYAVMSTDQRWDLRDTDLWAQVTCATGEPGDIEDHPSYRPRP